jgi:branched-chain amino acid transport system substrate-binding protein
MPATAEDIKVGLLLPYSGVYAALGQDIDDGLHARARRVRRRTGATFEIVREDTEVKPPVALAKTKKLILQDEVDVIVGVVSSGVLGAIRDVVDGAGVPLIVANAGNDEATGEACAPYITRMSFSNGQVNRPMGTWMVRAGHARSSPLPPTTPPAAR